MTTAAERAPGAACRCSSRPAGGYEVKLVEGRADRRVRAATRRSTSRWASTRSCGSSTSRARGRATTSSCRCTAPTARPPDEPASCTAAELLWDAAQGAVAERRPAGARRRGVPRARSRRRRAARARHVGRGARRRVRDRRPPPVRVGDRARAAGRRRGAADDPGVAKEGRDLELPPWNKGRYGTAIGRAVHAVLQTIDLATGAGPRRDLAAAQAAAEGVLGTRRRSPRSRSRRSTSPTVRAACARRALARDLRRGAGRRASRSRATSTSCTATDRPDGARRRRLQDRRDRRRRDARGPDRRTTGSRAPRTRSRSRRRRAQRVDRCVFVFLAPGGVREVEIAGDELAAAVAEVRALVAAVRDDPPPLGAVVLADA